MEHQMANLGGGRGEFPLLSENIMGSRRPKMQNVINTSTSSDHSEEVLYSNPVLHSTENVLYQILLKFIGISLKHRL